MAGTVDNSQFAIRQATRDFLRQAKRKGAVFRPVPKPYRRTDLFQHEAPWSGIHLRVDHYAFD